MKKGKFLITLILLALILLAGQERAATAAPLLQETNLLTNPSFEQPYNDGTAQGWNRWHRETAKGDGCESGYHYLPKWLIETNGELVADGITSQKVGNTWDTWHAGTFQTVNATLGETYRFTVLARGRASNENYPQPSEGGINMNVQVGIDPNGSGVWSDGDVVWSATGSPHDSWQTFSVEATATGDKITVFTAANFGIPGSNQCRKFMDVWFDKAELVSAAPPPPPTNPPPPPQPEATAVPQPTVTPLPEPTAETPPTEAPQPEGSPTTAPSSGGTICVNTFDDVNSNGIRDANEGFMPGVSIIVAAANGDAVRFITEGTEAPRCVEGLEPGIYQVAQQVPSNLQMTTAANTSVESVAGATTAVSFGSRSRSGEAVAPAPVEDDSQEVDQGGSTDNQDPGQAPAPTSGGMICLNAFHDENSNGLHDNNEGYMGGVTLRVSNTDGFAEETISQGSATPYCLDSLQPGTYQVAQEAPNRVVLTTAENAMVTVAEGKTISVAFGSRLDVGDDTIADGDQTADPDSPQPEEETGSNLLAVGGLVVIVLAVVAIGALLFVFLRR